MLQARCLALTAALMFLAVGCARGPAGGRGGEEHLQANLAKLGEEDRKLAEARRWCPVADDNRLGEVGVPVKVVLQQRPVFLCCKGCVREAQRNPGRTLAKVEELKARAAAIPKG
jgi:hypothetical protein